jgi:hypothetical protein
VVILADKVFFLRPKTIDRAFIDCSAGRIVPEESRLLQRDVRCLPRFISGQMAALTSHFAIII